MTHLIIPDSVNKEDEMLKIITSKVKFYSYDTFRDNIEEILNLGNYDFSILINKPIYDICLKLYNNWDNTIKTRKIANKIMKKNGLPHLRNIYYLLNYTLCSIYNKKKNELIEFDNKFMATCFCSLNIRINYSWDGLKDNNGNEWYS